MINQFQCYEIPRVLMVNSQNIYKNNATGITMRSMWREFDQSKILEVFRYESKVSVEDKSICFRSIQIPPETKPLNYTLRKILNLDNYYDSDGIRVNPVPMSSMNTSLKRDVITIVKSLVEDEKIKINESFLGIIDEFKPEVVYTMGASFFVNSWALFFSRRYDIPIVMHYMDNWRETMFMDSIFTKWLNRRMTRQLQEIEKRMHCGLTISEKMANTYRTKYGGSYKAIMNTVKSIPVRKIRHAQMQIIYAGGLHLNRDKHLLEIAQTLKMAKNIRLIVYTSQKNCDIYKNTFKDLHVEFREAVHHDNIASVYEEADVLLHIESFLPEDIEFTRYSLSTKIPEYMLSGKPIICYAPSCIAVYEYLKDNDCGICIDESSLILDVIEHLKDDDYVASITQKAIAVAKENHSIENMKYKMLEVLRA